MKNIIALLCLMIFATNPSADTVLTRFRIPTGYEHVKTQPGSFSEWLQNLPLKPAGTHTLTYDGHVAATDPYTAAVVDMSVGTTDLQQCADAVMRLRGEYLYHKENFAAISFKFESGFKCDYLHYANGYRYSNDKWVLTAKKDYSYPTFMRYMKLVFMYAGTLSLQKELHPVNDPAELKTGDVFIHGGSPGHCFIVMDVVENSVHQKQFMLAQSFMPAQNIQLLQSNGSPWFSLNQPAAIPYAELISMSHLKKFE
jgi:hypothetical protein